MNIDQLLKGDALAGLSVAAVMFAGRAILEPLYALPGGIYLFIAAANLSYSGYAWGLVWHGAPTRTFLRILVAANAAWALVCAAVAFQVVGRASAFGVAHVLLEGAFVAALACVEWRVGLSASPYGEVP